MTVPDDVLIVGASVGGLTVAEALRRKGFTGRIRVVGEEPRPPYGRPPLSKEVLIGRWSAEAVHLRPAGGLDELGVDWLLGHRAKQLRLDTRTVALDRGKALSYGALVIATGLVPNRPDGFTDAHTLRTLDDALRLRQKLQTARRVAVIGAGVLGCEVAAACCVLGKQATLIDPGPAPMALQLGAELGSHVAALHESRGVRLRTGVGAARLISEDGKTSGVELASGEVVEADLAVLAAGSAPATGWLVDSGLRLEDGVCCDASLRAADDVYAVGDVARWHDPGTGTARLETRTNATEQALVVADNILGGDRRYNPIPYFWSDQYDTKIQVHGVIAAHARIRIAEGDPREGRFLALAEGDDGVTAAIGWNHPRGVRTARRTLRSPLPVGGIR
ncbi:NAD(P)/FAD-dependent oxidoreductase [Saccharopolyspora shandongensis]|uniref:NAD(P)/FAD-dependent oxidoreductase n=1 Tax=Saccharopolyspora shandongensis TaxID=418495 RepID=UPI0033F495F5